ncbi:MAG: hypothetical protein IJI58_03245 [Bacilli bacterium]|nr:hypothetical protein [Bacilli bacterium]
MEKSKSLDKITYLDGLDDNIMETAYGVLQVHIDKKSDIYIKENDTEIDQKITILVTKLIDKSKKIEKIGYIEVTNDKDSPTKISIDRDFEKRYNDDKEMMEDAKNIMKLVFRVITSVSTAKSDFKAVERYINKNNLAVDEDEKEYNLCITDKDFEDFERRVEERKKRKVDEILDELEKRREEYENNPARIIR